ncbi:hypothetical protein MASR1M60_15760 [Rhodocyclaceae bacterium]
MRVNMHLRFLEWADSVGLDPYKQESLSRVDFTFDYWIDAIDFDEDSFVTSAVKDNQHRKNRKVQTFTFGTNPIVLRVYNKSDEIAEKSGKTWFYTHSGVVRRRTSGASNGKSARPCCASGAFDPSLI